MAETNTNNVVNVVDEAGLEAALSLLFQSIIKQVPAVVTKDNPNFAAIAAALATGASSTEDGAKAASVDLVAEMVKRSKHIRYTIVYGKDISKVVKSPEDEMIYLLKEDSAEDTTVEMYMYLSADSTWVSLGAVAAPELNLVTGEESINNIVAHVKRGETDFAGSTNVKATDLVSAQSLTEVLVALGVGLKKKTIYFSESKGRAIANVVTKPDVDTLYLYQQTDDKEDWAVYMVVSVAGTSGSENVWLKLSGGASATAEVDLSNYWSKDELKVMSADDVKAIVESAIASV